MPIKPRNDLTAEEVRERLEYDTDLGILRWRYNPSRPKEWNTRRAGKAAGFVDTVNGNVQVRIDDRLYLGYRLIWLIVTGEWPKVEIDHINGVRTDNRLKNLREATHAENSRNRGRQKNNQSGFLGVCFRPHHGKWEARINLDGKTVWRHYATTAQEASAARREALPKFHGEFVRGS